MFIEFITSIAIGLAHPIDPQHEVRAHLDAEQAAFFGGDCEATVAHWANEFTMVVEGEVRATNRAELQALCENVMRMVAAGRIPSGANGPKVIARDIYMLSDTLAYEVTRRTTPVGARSSVTKLVSRKPDGWQIIHLHEAIAAAADRPAPDAKR